MIQAPGDTEVIVGAGQPTICTVAVAVLGAAPTVTVAISVGSLAGGATVAVICVALTTFTFDTATTAPLGVVTLTADTGQNVEVALAVVIKLVPVIVTGL